MHYADKDVDDPDGPAGEAEAEDHVDAEDPGVLFASSQLLKNSRIQRHEDRNLQVHPCRYLPDSDYPNDPDEW